MRNEKSRADHRDFIFIYYTVLQSSDMIRFSNGILTLYMLYSSKWREYAEYRL